MKVDFDETGFFDESGFVELAFTAVASMLDLTEPSAKTICAFVLAPASFLTFRKVNPVPSQTDILLGGGRGPPHPSPSHFCQRRPTQTDIFGGEGRGSNQGIFE